jgi:hypothetical protein
MRGVRNTDGVVAVSHLQLIDRLGGNAPGEDLVDSFEGIMIALEPEHTFFYRKTLLHGIFQAAQPTKLRKMLIK